MGGFRTIRTNGLPAGVRLAGAAVPRLVFQLVAVTRLEFTVEAPEGSMPEPVIIEQEIQAGQDFDLVLGFLDANGNPRDMRSATNLIFRLEAPDGTSVDYTDSIVPDTDGLDGAERRRMAGASVADVGVYRAQAFATIDGLAIKSRLGLFRALENAAVPA